MRRRIIVYNDGVTRTVDWRDGGPGSGPSTGSSNHQVFREKGDPRKAASTSEQRMLSGRSPSKAPAFKADPGKLRKAQEQAEATRRLMGQDGTGIDRAIKQVISEYESGKVTRSDAGKKLQNLGLDLDEARALLVYMGNARKQQDVTQKKFEVRMYEKAEHWTFDIVIWAQDEKAARAQIAKEYSPRSYSIRDLREVSKANWDGVGSPEEVAYGEGWHSASNSNPYDEPALKASWEKGRAARRQKQKQNTNYRQGELRNKKFEPARQRSSNDMSRDYKSEKGYVAKLVDATTGAVLARSEPHISNGAGLKTWIQTKANELIRRGKRVKAEVVIVFFDPNMA